MHKILSRNLYNFNDFIHLTNAGLFAIIKLQKKGKVLVKMNNKEYFLYMDEWLKKYRKKCLTPPLKSGIIKKKKKNKSSLKIK